MDEKVIDETVADGSLVLTITRESAGNSLSAETAAAISEALGRHRDAVRCVILTGAGGRFFCAGGDIKRYRALRTAEQVHEVFQGPRGMLDALEALPVPVIAAVNGYALGGGAELMLAADLRVASAHARIGFPQSRLGIIPGWHGIQRLARDVGHARAMKLLMTGEMLGASQAMELGLVHEVAPEGEALERAFELARALEASGPLALAGAKRVLHAVHRLPEAESRQVADRELVDLWLSEDHREAEAAFEAKRTPRFSGR